MARLVFCSKSWWTPAIRREHELAKLAAAAGHSVVFVERPLDLRAIREVGVLSWAKRLLFPSSHRDESGVLVVSRSTFVPGHRGALPALVDNVLLRRVLARWSGATVIVSLPWDWPATARSAARRVFDSADDWAALIERGRPRLRRLYATAAKEADAVICDSRHLAYVFAPREVSVIANGTQRHMLAAPLTPPPGTKTMAYAGTLSVRFDTELLDQVLQRLPDWKLRIFGVAQYPGLGDAPAPELQALLDTYGDRVDWPGVIARDRLAAELDTGDVLVIPHRREGAVGGDSMKYYDYASRGRPTVSSRWSDDIQADGPPHTYVAGSAGEFADAVVAAAAEPAAYETERRVWAEDADWNHRFAAWAAVALA